MYDYSPAPRFDAVVGFSGPGGSSHGLRLAGVATAGIEKDQDACDTAVKMGLRTTQADITTLDPEQFRSDMFGERTRPLITQFSPPCPGFSQAGKGVGRTDLPMLQDALHNLATMSREDAIEISLHWRKLLQDECADGRSSLTFEPIHWIASLHPEYVFMEQVPGVLVVWEAYAETLRAWGYSVWTGKVYAEQYGVPQTRIRAFLIASRVHEVTAPVATHSRFHTRSPKRLDEGVEKWVSMAEALGWGLRQRPYPSVTAGTSGGGQDSLMLGGSGARKIIFDAVDSGNTEVWTPKPEDLNPTPMGDVYNAHGAIRSIDEPSATLTSSMDNGNFRFFDKDNPPRQVVDRLAVRLQMETETVDGHPRVNNQSGSDFDLAWPADRPAPHLLGRGLVPMPGANANRFNGSTKSRNDGIRVSVQEAAVLQSFPPDWSFQGSRTSAYQQVGNAVPPLLQYVLTIQTIGE